MTDVIPPPARVAARGALLLDFDGTLVPIAPRPDEVQLPPGLVALLQRLHRRLDGALAIVTGRDLETLDDLLAPLVLPAAGEHGLVLRPTADRAAEFAARHALPEFLRIAGQALMQAHPGTVLEVKRAGIALHYRAVPEAAGSLLGAMRALAAMHTGHELLRGHMLLEIRPRGIHKGTAVRALMRAHPFAGRTPVFVGDDFTDEDGIAASLALGGHGMRMAETFRTPERLGEWLHRIAEVRDDAAA